VWIRDGEKLKLPSHSYPKHREMGFRKWFFYWNRGMEFDMKSILHTLLK